MCRTSLTKSGRIAAGFTLVEATVALAITTVAGAALLLGINSSIQTTNEALDQTIAAGMAQQLLDEIVGGRYAAVGVDGYQTSFGPSSWEKCGAGRERYDDIDDYHGLSLQPPEDCYGIELGTEDGEGDQRHPNFQAPPGFFDRWKQEVEVYYVGEADLGTRLAPGQVSDYRAIEVRVLREDPERGWQELARRRRVVAYVPPM